MTATISTLCLGALDNFVHFIVDDATKSTFLVDPSCEPKTLLAHIETQHFELQGILLTHSHGDHIAALAEILKKFDVPTYITSAEFDLGRVRIDNPCLIKNGGVITLGESQITAYETDGHTIGGACFQVNNTALITGDTLFIDGCGRCNFVESDIDKMWASLQYLKTLPDDLVIYCGHDYGKKTTDTLGNQKLTNPYLLIDDKDFFIDFRMNLQSDYRTIPFEPSSYDEMQAIRERHS